MLGLKLFFEKIKLSLFLIVSCNYIQLIPLINYITVYCVEFFNV